MRVNTHREQRTPERQESLLLPLGIYSTTTTDGISHLFFINPLSGMFHLYLVIVLGYECTGLTYKFFLLLTDLHLQWEDSLVGFQTTASFNSQMRYLKFVFLWVFL